jgi:hypothetical protein
LRDKVVPRPASTIDGAEPTAEPQVSKTSPPPSSPKSTSVKSTYLDVAFATSKKLQQTLVGQGYCGC